MYRLLMHGPEVSHCPLHPISRHELQRAGHNDQHSFWSTTPVSSRPFLIILTQALAFFLFASLPWLMRSKIFSRSLSSLSLVISILLGAMPMGTL